MDLQWGLNLSVQQGLFNSSGEHGSGGLDQDEHPWLCEHCSC